MAETKKPKTKAELMAEKMRKQQVGKTAFDAGKKPIVETDPAVNAPETPQDAQKVEEGSQAVQEEKTAQEPQSVAEEPKKTASTKKPAQKKTKPKQEKAAPAETEEKPQAASKGSSWLDNIGKNEKVEKKNYTLYFSVKNGEMLEKVAAQKGMSKGGCLDDILTQVFTEAGLY